MWWSAILTINGCVYFNYLSFLFYWKKVVCIILSTEFKYSCFEICSLCSVGGPTIPKQQKEIQNERENISRFPLERNPGWRATAEICIFSRQDGRATSDHRYLFQHLFLMCFFIFSFFLSFLVYNASAESGAGGCVRLRRCLRKKSPCCNRAGEDAM